MLNQAKLLLCTLVALVAAADSGRAQSAAPTAAGRLAGPARGLARDAFGLTLSDGGWIGNGPGYSVAFERGSFTFAALSDLRSEPAPELGLRTLSVERGGEPLWDGTSVLGWSLDAVGARIELAAGLVERRELRREGLELSYALARRPAGSGDLAVRLGFASAYTQRSGDPEHGWLLSSPGCGGVRIGAVTGVAADGHTWPGTLAFEGRELVLRLPAACLDSAQYPLVLDPLVSAATQLTGSTDDGFSPDTSFDAPQGNFLVVWEQSLANGQHGVFGKLVNTSGAVVGGLLTIQNYAAPLARHVVVGDCRASGRFAVVWQEATSPLGPWSLVAVAVNAGTGAVSAKVQLGSVAGSVLSAEIGGNATTGLANSSALPVVFRLEGVGLRSLALTVPASGNPSWAAAAVALSNDPTDAAPAIASSGGSAQRYLAAWERGPAGAKDIVAAVLDPLGAVVVAPAAVAAASSALASESAPECAGDGARWALVWRRLGSGSSDATIQAATATLSGGPLAIGNATAIGSLLATDLRMPAAGWTPLQLLAAWAQEGTGLADDVEARGVSTVDLRNCESAITLTTPASGTDRIELATTFDGGSAASPGNALLVWGERELDTFPFDGDVFAQLWAPLGGLAAVDLGGACSGGIATVPCPAVQGSPNFVHAVEGVGPNTALALLLGFQDANLACGSGCVLHVDPTLAPFFLFVVPSGSSGQQPMTIPTSATLVGLQVVEQWAAIPTSGASCALTQTTLSNGLRLTLQ